MKLRIISVGHKMPSWVETACAEYTKRMPRDASIEIIDIKPEKRAAGNSTENIQLIEAKRILEAIGKDYLIALDERGQEVTTLQLAEKFKAWQDGAMTGNRDIALVIGGADGLHTSVKQKADWLWSLSKLTLPHAMVRIILAEQLYRAHSVINNHPYHRE
ncbi:MAG TPA: 23S rRNA (pseudouridine(1915)-N(3))-methyltransferase RlmH [Methylotenera sp.]|nr:23S rRNA (pseudouridine(1915)-N(3))-methyltransferase RlmH [Methylotenera sp.]